MKGPTEYNLMLLVMYLKHNKSIILLKNETSKHAINISYFYFI